MGMDRRRDLLHRSKLAEFVAWAEAAGWQQEPPKPGSYEVAKLMRAGAKRPVIIYRRDSGDHLTTFAGGTSLVQRWLKERTHHG